MSSRRPVGSDGSGPDGPGRPTLTQPGTAPGSGVLVLGMHRSGTSAATRLISLLGPALCPDEDLVVTSEANPTGHWESQTLVEFNDGLLREMGRTWWCPPPAPGAAYDAALARITTSPENGRQVFTRLHPEGPWVWKDPRTVATLPYWREALPGSWAAVAMVRNPLDVAVSLQRRNKFSLSLGVALWERYNRLLLAGLAGMPVLMSRYDEVVEDPVAWSKQVREFLAHAGVALSAEVDPAVVESFVEADLRHHRHSTEELAADFPSTAGVWAVLESALGPHDGFASPPLEREPAWVEAELAAIGAVQKAPVPSPPTPVVSVVVDGGPAFSEGGPGAAGPVLAWRPRLPAGYFDVSVVHSAHRPRGAARNQAVAAARGEIVVFVGSGVRVSDNWWPELRRALAAGYSAVAPAVRAPDGQLGYGMTWKDRWLNRQWGPPPAGDGPTPVLLLPDECFAVTRAALEEVGGFDPELGIHGLDTVELCLRLWRAGHSCAVVPAAVAEPPAVAEPAPGGHAGAQPPWEGFLHDLISLASVHLDEHDLAYLIDGLRPSAGFTIGAARALAGDIGQRRRDVEGAARLPAAAVLERFGGRLDPTKAARLEMRGRSRADRGEAPPQGDHRLVLVGGLHGSGLGLVTRILAGHPLVSAFANTGVWADEGQHLQDVYRAAQDFGGPGRFAANPESHMDETAAVVTAGEAPAVLGRRLFGQWSPHWDLSRPVLVEKSPPNLVRTRFLQALFPGCRFVMVQRHPVATALLTSVSPVGEMDELLENWLSGWERFETDRPELDHAMVLGYEALLADPGALCAALGDFVELAGLDAAGLIDPETQGQVAELWRQALEEAGPGWLDRLVERFGARAAVFGYDLSEPCAVGSAEAVPGPGEQ